MATLTVVQNCQISMTKHCNFLDILLFGGHRLDIVTSCMPHWLWKALGIPNSIHPTLEKKKIPFPNINDRLIKDLLSQQGSRCMTCMAESNWYLQILSPAFLWASKTTAQPKRRTTRRRRSLWRRRLRPFRSSCPTRPPGPFSLGLRKGHFSPM